MLAFADKITEDIMMIFFTGCHLKGSDKLSLVIYAESWIETSLRLQIIN